MGGTINSGIGGTNWSGLSISNTEELAHLAPV